MRQSKYSISELINIEAHIFMTRPLSQVYKPLTIQEIERAVHGGLVNETDATLVDLNVQDFIPWTTCDCDGTFNYAVYDHADPMLHEFNFVTK